MKLPKGWIKSKFKGVLHNISINNLKVKKKDYLLQGKLPVIDQGQELIGGYTNNIENKIDEEPPFIIFGDHTRILKFINFSFAPGADGVKVLKAKNNIDSKLLYYFLKVIINKVPNKGYARHFQYLTKENIPLPPLPEQHRIVKKIEELFSELDNGIENLQKAKEQINTYRQSVLKAAFEGKLTNENVKNDELPKGWKWLSIKDICSKVEYGSSKKSEKEGRIPVLRMGNIQHYFFDWTDLVYSNDDEEITKYRLKKGDVLFNRTNSPELVGKTAIYLGEREAIFAGYLIRIHYNSDINPKYLNYYLNSLNAKEYGNTVKTDGVNQSNINGQRLKGYPFPYCKKEEQNKVVSEIEQRFSVADKLEESIDQSLQQAETLRQSILKKAFEGKLVPQDPNDEPAEKLLEKIKTP
ncbi:MAG: type restriction enzyme subunit [Bacteroidales bacterium]|nr:type restriction enzyme subunit [Bacteroidales bacterium]